MREIKFRGQESRTGLWVYGGFVQRTTGAVQIAVNRMTYTRFINVIPDSVGQHTGLPDSNGVDIYEGDICFDEIDEEKCVVVYKDDGFYAEYPGHIIDLYEVNDRIEVLGDIENDGIMKDH